MSKHRRADVTKAQVSMSPAGQQPRMHSVHLEQFSGPLPHPDTLERYEQIHHGAADRIFSMTESQSRHRQVLESTVVRGNVSAQARGQWMGFSIAMAGMIGGVYLLRSGLSIAGYISMFVPLGGLAGLFLWTRRRQEKERDRKVAEQPPPAA